MSLQEVSLRSIALKQYVYKVKSYSSLVYSLFLAQIFAILTSLAGTMNMGTGYDGISINLKSYSGDFVIVISFLWIFLIAALLATKHYQEIAFSLVTNRLSNNLANIGFLLTCALFSGMTASLSGVFLRIIGYFRFDHFQIIRDGFFIQPADLMLGIYATSLYLFLFASLGYLVRTVIEINKALYIIIPVVFLGFLTTNGHASQEIFKFFAEEHSLAVFTFKILILSGLLFGISLLISNRMEFRR